MRVHTINTPGVPSTLINFFLSLCADNVSYSYAAYFISICGIFVSALESEDEYFIVKEPTVVFKRDLDIDSLQGTTLVETLSGDGFECVLYSRDFAKLYLENIDVRVPFSVVIKGMFPDYKTNIVAVDTNSLAAVNPDPYQKKWGVGEYNFLRSYQSTNVKYSDIINDYNLILEMKAKVEENFKATYDVENISIENFKYIKINGRED
jgi:hypothetical protein